MYALARSINRQMAAAGNSLSSGHSKTQQWERVADVAQIMGRGESEAAGNVIVIQAGKRKRKSKSKKKKKRGYGRCQPRFALFGRTPFSRRIQGARTKVDDEHKNQKAGLTPSFRLLSF